MKKNVHTNRSKTLRECYNEAQRNFVTLSIPERVIAAYFPTFNKISGTLNKIRSSNKPSIPEDFTHFEKSGDYTRTKNHQEFLCYEKKSKERRIIIFVQNAALQMLSESTNWFMDGTFKCSPKQFVQMYTIHAESDKTTFPCVYIFAQKKRENIP
ncbi:unnamed protein product [Brachionus calyciflorus]|uniref:MULE transposase domain-containing protein n=1 Tax=Brachionus calyciflorus TaxID=104777 RepID=A0A814HP72_9BILA|nr:unnamed protein product [Brachionus calyciflorus]